MRSAATGRLRHQPSGSSATNSSPPWPSDDLLAATLCAQGRSHGLQHQVTAVVAVLVIDRLDDQRRSTATENGCSPARQFAGKRQRVR